MALLGSREAGLGFVRLAGRKRRRGWVAPTLPSRRWVPNAIELSVIPEEEVEEADGSVSTMWGRDLIGDARNILFGTVKNGNVHIGYVFFCFVFHE